MYLTCDVISVFISNMNAACDVSGPLVSHTAIVYKHSLYVFAGGDGKTANNKLNCFDCGATRTHTHSLTHAHTHISECVG